MLFTDSETDAKCLRMQSDDASDAAKSSAPQIEVTPGMIKVGVSRLNDLLEAGVSSAYLVEEVFLAMVHASAQMARQRAASAEICARTSEPLDRSQTQ